MNIKKSNNRATARPLDFSFYFFIFFLSFFFLGDASPKTPRQQSARFYSRAPRVLYGIRHLTNNKLKINFIKIKFTNYLFIPSHEA